MDTAPEERDDVEMATPTSNFVRHGRRRFYSIALFIVLFFLVFDDLISVAYAKDYYELLGVPRDAPSSAIKKAYFKLSVKYHPDKNPGDKEAQRIYAEINNAYEVLKDEQKRERYDMFGEKGVNNQGGGDDDDDDGMFGFGGMFDGFGGGGRRRRQQREQRVPDVVIPMPVTLESLYNGAIMESVHKRRVICSSWSDCEKTCPMCKGRGVVITTRRIGPGFVQQMQTTCPKCGGTGKISVDNCKSCPKGQFEETEKALLIDVEKGMADGQMVTFEGQTDEMPDHANGDVKFKIVTVPHDRFARNGDDLHYTLRVTLSEALIGVHRQVRQLDGRLVKIDTDKIISPGEEVVIAGEGMPSVHGGQTGNLVVKFWVDFPSNLTDDQKKAVIDLHGDVPTLEQTGDGTKGGMYTDSNAKTEL